MDLRISKCPADFLANKYWKMKVFLSKNKSHFLHFETNKLRELPIALAPNLSNFAHVQSFLDAMGETCV